jgi:hypothetical protein
MIFFRVSTPLLARFFAHNLPISYTLALSLRSESRPVVDDISMSVIGRSRVHFEGGEVYV